MVDIEKLALKRDKAYLVRLVLLLLLGMGLGLVLASYLTGSSVSGCLTNAFIGSQEKEPSQ